MSNGHHQSAGAKYIESFKTQQIISSLKAVLAAGLLMLLAYMGETGKDGGFIKEIWAAAKTASPFAAMFCIIAWLSERRERQQSQQFLQDRTLSFVESTNQQASALEKMVEAVKQVSNSIDLSSGRLTRRTSRKRGQ